MTAQCPIGTGSWSRWLCSKNDCRLQTQVARKNEDYMSKNGDIRREKPADKQSESDKTVDGKSKR